MAIKRFLMAWVMMVCTVFVAGGITITGAVNAAPAVAYHSIHSWINGTISIAGKDIGQFSSLALDPHTGLPYVSFYNATDKDLMFARYVGSGGNCGPSGAWNCETVDATGDVGRASSIAAHYFPLVLPFHSYTAIGIAYQDTTNTQLKFAEYSCPTLNPCGWHITKIDTTKYSYHGEYISLKYDNNGKPRIAYFSGNSTSYLLNWAVYGSSDPKNCGPDASNQNQWVCFSIDSLSYNQPVPYSFSYVSQSIDQNNFSKIAYIENNLADPTQARLFYAYPYSPWGNCGASYWQCDQVMNLAVDMPISMAMGADGQPRIAFHYLTNLLEVANYVGTGGNCGPTNIEWKCTAIARIGYETGQPMPDLGLSLAIDAVGFEHILFYFPGGSPDPNNTPKNLWIAQDGSIPAKNNCGPGGVSWYCTPVDPQQGAGRYPSVAIGPSGLAVVTYYDEANHVLKYAQEVLPVFLPLAMR